MFLTARVFCHHRTISQMGCAASLSSASAARKNKVSDSRLAAEQEESLKKVNVLLVGGNNSGKSTIAKQMKIIYKNGFSFEERCLYRSLVYDNIFTSIQAVTKAMHSLNIYYDSLEREEDAKELPLLIADIKNGTLPFKVITVIKRLWADHGVQECFSRASEYQLSDSAGYYLSELDRIGAPDYCPSEQDVLRTRVKTTGIIETHFNFRDLHFRMFDVGGQRSERKKWIHCFEGVTAIIFCAALSAYDLVLAEDEETNRMKESLQIFDSICNSQWFVNTPIVLFLNKKDLFAEKIKSSPLTVCFPEYDGANTAEECSDYVKERFINLCNENTRRRLFVYFTCATDTANIQLVFNSVTDVIIKSRIKSSGFL